MNQRQQAHNRYSQVKRETASDKHIELQLFASITGKLRTLKNNDNQALTAEMAQAPRGRLMSGLVISLKANEKFLVNGALLVNGDKRSQISVPNDDVYILRVSDALHPKDVTTPVRRVYYGVQLILSGDGNTEDMRRGVKDGLDALAAVFYGTPMSKALEKAQNAFAKGRFYSVLYTLKSLLNVEEQLLQKMSEGQQNFASEDVAPRMAASA